FAVRFLGSGSDAVGDRVGRAALGDDLDEGVDRAVLHGGRARADAEDAHPRAVAVAEVVAGLERPGGRPCEVEVVQREGLGLEGFHGKRGVYRGHPTSVKTAASWTT